MARIRFDSREQLLWGLFIMVSLASCSSVSRVHPPTADDAGVVRLAEVMQIATRQQIVALGSHYNHLLAAGITDSDLRDGSLGAGRVYCCGGPPEQGAAIWFYIPRELNIQVGNIVEVKMGRQPADSDPGVVNSAIRVRHLNMSQGPCRWSPERDGLWMRVIHCDWMEREGWVERDGLYNTWFKPAPR